MKEEKYQLTREEEEWNRSIARAGTLVSAVGIALTIGAIYITNVLDYGFDNTNRQIANSISRGLESFNRSPRGLGPYE